MASGPHIATQWRLPETPYAKAANSDAARSNMHATVARAEPSAAPTTCAHCGLPALAGETFCCPGCAHASSLLAAVSAAQLAAAQRIHCDIQGMHCAACVTLIAATFKGQSGAGHIEINPALGSATLSVDASTFSLSAFAAALAPMGYRVALVQLATQPAASAGLLLRLGVCLALAANSMVFSFAVYFGLGAKDGALHRVIGYCNFAIATLVLLVGGSYFLGNAWRALRARVWHVDIPLALSVVLSYGGATALFFLGGLGATYFDTFAAYVGLMLVGKYLPARLIEINRRTLLQDDGLAALPQSLLRGRQRERVNARAIVEADTLLVLPGDLLSVDAILLDGDARCTLDWISGEAEPVHYTAHAHIPAGAFNIGDTAFTARALTAFKDSSLHALLGAPQVAAQMRSRQQLWIERFARVFVSAVFVVAALTFIAWFPFDPMRGLWATVCVLIVACPCAIGLGMPLALELSLRRLRHAGVFVRREESLAKLADVDSLVFDKTGTLSELALSTASYAVLAGLSARELQAIAAMATQSNHPAARAIRDALPTHAPAGGGAVRELAGVGLATGDYVLRRSADETHTLELFCEERRICALRIEERLRTDAAAELWALRKAGYRLAVLSGDRKARVHELCAALPIELGRCVGDATPDDKRAWIERHADEKTLVLGDGVNDLPAFAASFCAGTPAIDRPFVPARADFYYRARGLWPIREALTASRAYAHANRFNYGFALCYNIGVLSAAAAGVMTPLIAAVLMPLSSILIVVLNVAIVRHGKERTWKSS